MLVSFFFFSSRRRHTRSKRDWSSDVCSSDLDAEVAGVVDGGLGPQRLAFLVVLLDFRVLVVDVQRRDHALGEDPGAEPDRKSTRLNSSHVSISYAVFCLKK